MTSNKTRMILAALVAATVLAAAGDAAAQRRPRRPPRQPRPAPAPAFRYERARALPEIGIRGGNDFRTDAGFIGADLRLPVGRRGPLALAPSADLFFNTPGHDWQANLDAVVRAPLSGLYGGGGAALLHHEFDPLAGRETKLGWNLVAGLEPSLLPVRPFVETRWTFRGEHFSAFRLAGGIRATVGGHRGDRWARAGRR